MIDAFLTDTPVTKESCCWAEEPIIMQCLHDRYICLAASRIDRGRDHDECVVDMNEVWFFPPQQCRKLFSRLACPDCPFRQGDALPSAISIGIPIASFICDNFMPSLFQKTMLLLENEVLPSRLLIRIVSNNDLHLFSPGSLPLSDELTSCRRSPFDTYMTSACLLT